MTILSLIKRIRRRARPLGIGTAADYLRELEVCLGGRCPSGLLAGVSRRQWRDWLKAARRKLVYHHAEMRPLSEMEGPRDGEREGQSGGGNSCTTDLHAPLPPSLPRSVPPPLTPTLPPHTIATFPAVITTTRQDLDGDVLQTSGAELDPQAPLLWQHLPDLPIGRLLEVGERTNQRLTGRFAIANTALGQDAALLAEHGALRISHGFLPTKWETLDSDDPFAGYHILEFKILEVSLVSVPSNPDAVIEAFSREKLAHPLVKAWAGVRFEDRPAIVPVGFNPTRAASDEGRESGGGGEGENSKSPTLLVSPSPSPVAPPSPPLKSGRAVSQESGARLTSDSQDDDGNPTCVGQAFQPDKNRASAAPIEASQPSAADQQFSINPCQAGKPDLHSQPQGTFSMQTENQVQPAEVFHAAGQPRVKRASEQYDSTKRRLSWPGDKKSALHLGRLAGHDVTFENRPAYESSQLEKAQAGAWLKHKLASQLGTAHLLSEHDRDLYQELVERGEWVGEVRDGEGTHYYREPGRLSPPHQKTLLADSTSGGQYAVPYFFDVDLVTFPLLYGELFPLVDLRELNAGNQVKGATLANMTISAGPAEGDTPGVTLQTTSGLVGQLTTNIYNATGAISVGRDFLSDSPIDLQAEIISLYQRSLSQWLDKEIAVGDGTTGPLGLFSTSGVLTATSKNSTAGPMTVSDVESMVKTLPKQYRNRQDNVVWVASDGLYFRIRGISVSGTDARRIFGYDYEQYMLASHPFKIQNDVVGSDLAFVNLSKYRMWRRKGMELQVSDDGKALMLANELLIVVRSRWGGQLVDPNAMVEMTNAALH